MQEQVSDDIPLTTTKVDHHQTLNLTFLNITNSTTKFVFVLEAQPIHVARPQDMEESSKTASKEVDAEVDSYLVFSNTTSSPLLASSIPFVLVH